ncbi:pleckstriny domain-containing family A member 1 isoform X1, partial [Biomphalaria glabrata]
VSDGAKQRPKVQYCLTITVAGRQYFLQAEEDADKWKWIEAIKNASKIKVPPKLESSSAQKEWRAADVTQEAYITEIAGGVVCKMPIQQSTEIDLESNTDDSESRSSSSGRISPTSSLSRGIGFSRDSGSIQEPNKTGTMQNLKPLKSGYCVKQGAVRKNWKRRFFVLYAQGLSYYKSEQEKQAIRTIPIEDILDVRQSVEGLHPNRDNLFEVRTTKRIFFIQCDTPEEMRGWIDVVNSAMSQKQKHTADRKSMQDGTGRHPLDDELCSGTYPSPIWKHHFMSAREKSSKETKHQKKSFILW